MTHVWEGEEVSSHELKSFDEKGHMLSGSWGLCIYLFKSYLLMAFCVPGILLHARDSVVNRRKWSLPYFYSNREIQTLIYQLIYQINKQDNLW